MHNIIAIFPKNLKLFIQWDIYTTNENKKYKVISPKWDIKIVGGKISIEKYFTKNIKQLWKLTIEKK